MDTKHTNKELVDYFVQECKYEQEWKERYKQNFIEFDNYFKYSGKIEANKVLITQYRYNFNNNCNDLHEQFIKTQEYEKSWEKNKGHSGRFTEEITTYCGDETEDGIWSDKI